MSLVPLARGLVPLLTLAAVSTQPITCGSTTTTSDAGLNGVALEVGTGANGFEPLPAVLRDGGYEPVPIVQGPSGGYFLWGAVHAENLAPDDAHLDFKVKLVDPPTLISENPLDLSLLQNGSGYEWSGLIGLLPEDTRFNVRDQLVDLEMTITDKTGATTTSSRRVRPYLP